MTATIVITTKNRKEDLCRALESCVRQEGAPEILVIDDGSTDGTSQLVKDRFPSVRVVRFETSFGYIHARNEAARRTESDVIISIDDDAEFSQSDVVSTVLRELDNALIAAVAMPFIDVNLDNRLRQRAPSTAGIWVTNEYIGTAHAIRRQVFLDAGGYQEKLFHQGEEGDLCIRLLERGLFIRLGNSAPILHYHSPQRSQERMNVYGQRNLLLFAWYNVPMPEFIGHACLTIVKGLVWGLRRGLFIFRLRGTFLALVEISHSLASRKPVKRRIYWLYRKLKRQHAVTLDTVVGETKR